MKFLAILLVLLSSFAHAGEDCVFNEAVYIEFINNYSAENSNSKIGPDGRTLTVTRDNEEITVTGGGCIHLGVAIELKTDQEYTEEQFLQRTLDLSVEFGSWLINTNALKESIEKGGYSIMDGTWYIEVDAMTVFSASSNNQGVINVDFYIN